MLVDTPDTSCASDSVLYKRGHDHYRVDAEKCILVFFIFIDRVIDFCLINH